jgi:type VI secretion system protein ImpB
MARKESVQKKLQRVRPPRVQLTYDVEKGDAIEKKELPFVVGVVGDFSAQSKEELPKLKDRKFVNIDRDNFDDVMNSLKPRANYRVKNRLTQEGGTFAVDVTFKFHQ